MELTQAQKDALASAGIDWSKIDWAKWLQIVQTLLPIIISLFGSNAPKALAAAAGCPDEHAALMHGAICHNLQAADLCLQCCCAQGD